VQIQPVRAGTTSSPRGFSPLLRLLLSRPRSCYSPAPVPHRTGPAPGPAHVARSLAMNGLCPSQFRSVLYTHEMLPPSHLIAWHGIARHEKFPYQTARYRLTRKNLKGVAHARRAHLYYCPLSMTCLPGYHPYRGLVLGPSITQTLLQPNNDSAAITYLIRCQTSRKKTILATWFVIMRGNLGVSTAGKLEGQHGMACFIHGIVTSYRRIG
ncbi:hypothetical protein NEUTE2DRAFT_61820, partial [Neurospora tetrasperma FGSC 2509]